MHFVIYSREQAEHREAFAQLFSDYFDELFADHPKDNIPKHILPRIVDIIGEETQKYKEWLYLCVQDNAFIGFALFQIDTPDNPMCKRPGWGFIREFCIVPAHRRKGYAKAMCRFAEEVLGQNGANKIYLTADATTGVPFWAAVGYSFTGEYDDKNGNGIYIKYLIA